MEVGQATQSEPRRLSRLFRDLAAEGRDVVSVGDIAHAMRDRSFGAFLLAFSIPCILPLPPFTTIVLGIPLVLITWQMVLGRGEIWLPKFLTNRSVSGEKFKDWTKKGMKTLLFIEKAVKPRDWSLMRNPSIERAVAIFMFCVAVLVVLPIPLGNWLPAFAVAIFGASLSQRDEVWLKRSLILSVISFIVAGIVVIFGVQLFAYAWDWYKSF